MSDNRQTKPQQHKRRESTSKRGSRKSSPSKRSRGRTNNERHPPTVGGHSVSAVELATASPRRSSLSAHRTRPPAPDYSKLVDFTLPGEDPDAAVRRRSQGVAAAREKDEDKLGDKPLPSFSDFIRPELRQKPQRLDFREQFDLQEPSCAMETPEQKYAAEIGPYLMDLPVEHYEEDKKEAVLEEEEEQEKYENCYVELSMPDPNLPDGQSEASMAHEEMWHRVIDPGLCGRWPWC